MGNPRSSAILFTINPHNPQQVLIKGSTMTFENGHSNDLHDPDLQCFIINTQFSREINNLDIIYSFLIDIKYNTKYEDKNERDIILLKSCTRAIIGVILSTTINCRAPQEADYRGVHRAPREARRRAPHNSLFSSHLIQMSMWIK